jgi:2-dehydropantoate 2-reductase
MKIIVYGAGAVGGYLGARLAHAGHEVTVVARDVAAEAINSNGLTLTEAGQTIRTQPAAITSIARAFMDKETQYDLIVMTMKSYDLNTAVDHLVAFVADPPPIITVQNGIDVEQPLVRQFGEERVVAGSLTIPISREATNRLVVERDDRGLGLAPIKPRQNIRQWVNLFKEAGVNTVGVNDYQAMKWSKALLNMVGNATSAILNRAPHLVYKSAAMFDLEVQMLREALAVMDRLKLSIIDLPGASAGRLAFGVRRMPKLLLQPLMTQIVARGRGEKMPSFHIDLASGKGKSEVIYHNGMVAKMGQQVGVPTPVNTTLTDVLWKLTREEIDWREFNGRPARLLAEVKKRERA